jgi:hypothetical protein
MALELFLLLDEALTVIFEVVHVAFEDIGQRI